MSALLSQIERENKTERAAIREAWRSGFMAGCIAGFFTLAPIVVLVLMLGRAK